MPTQTIAPFLMSLAVLTACGVPVAPPAPQALTAGSSEDELKQERDPATLKFTKDGTETNPTFKKKFVMSHTPDLFIAYDHKGRINGNHKASFELTAPSGALYQYTDVPFAGNAHGVRVWSTLPIAGTWVEQYSMTGTWTVRVYLDDANDPVSTSTFLLQ
jgi:hypothetical protein